MDMREKTKTSNKGIRTKQGERAKQRARGRHETYGASDNRTEKAQVLVQVHVAEQGSLDMEMWLCSINVLWLPGLQMQRGPTKHEIYITTGQRCVHIL